MKNVLLFLFALVLSTTIIAQVPQGISYQAIAFTSTGAPVAGSNVGVRVSILDGSATGTALYVETHTKATNAQGVFNLVIGGGTAVSGTFSAISWASSSKYLKIEIDPAGGTSYTSTGVNQLMSVPFALAAASVVGSGSSSSVLDQLIAARTTNIAFDDDNARKVYAYSTTLGAWSSQAYTTGNSIRINASKGNFYFDDDNARKVYSFKGSTGVWSSQAYTSGNSLAIRVDTVSGSFAFDDDNARKVYVYDVTRGVWSSQAYTTGNSFAIMSSKGNFAFEDDNARKVYVYSTATGTWYSQAYTTGNSINLGSSNGNIYFDDDNSRKIYIFSSQTSAWTSQAYTTGNSVNIVVSAVE